MCLKESSHWSDVLNKSVTGLMCLKESVTGQMCLKESSHWFDVL